MLDTDTDHHLIASTRVEGTAVYDRYAKKVGTVHAIMIDKVSGQAEYATLLFGGFMGMGARAYPIPWAMLKYDRDLRGYCIDVRREDIEAAPYITLDKADRPHEVPEPAYRHWDQYM
ncbi:PRC-barrel domain-containing protein [Sphingomonas lenta]|uniref:Photosystem reaction center protein H n=1 Tax=Sphingomonas lenta TaxID=1141887 RepID=A0A2A2SJ76_9SPHN|nr:PRC-barrel domain-containing protein [Sphingomonas lenta]PAX09292.1 photosystem reaction center protein H [Sphingomonas lenta]